MLCKLGKADGISAFLTRFDPPARAVTVSWRDDAELQAYYLPPGAVEPTGAPGVVCVGETRSKEALFRLMARPSRARGLALLCVELGGPEEEPLRGSIRPETCISAMIDHLADEPGIDPARIAVISDGTASSLVARGIAFDGRAAAAVCDGGLWERWAGDHASPSPIFLADAMLPLGFAMPCPTLIPLRPAKDIDRTYARGLLASRLPQRWGEDGSGRVDLGDGLAAAQSRLPAGSILDWVRDRLRERIR
ncbi:hypothetical protein LPW26_14070 [Rhodopseudomonas sp. HC1]|uniref:alpha/beta hydrolase family protein n=1 Tax=Rhodopseudomonas infernalis TaxID=2897386 RepID=UPI001EE94DF1|nr:hypothetical protein [Rhodopseudomonas infernalis]MCG6205775.1 hypothetical protein [Rhodopseudomonas infernalis]